MESQRTRRKQNNRAALIKAAADLFETGGMDTITLAQVAARAGVHVQTLYRHFASKNELVAAIDQDYFDRFRRELEQRGPNVDTLSCWRDWIDRVSGELTRNREERHRKVLRRFWQTPTLSMNVIRVWYQYEELLTREIAVDLRVDPDADPLPRLLACMLWAGNVNAARRWAHASSGSLNEACVAVVDDATALLGVQLKARKRGARSRA